MKPTLLLATLLAVLAFAGCSTVQSRISQHQAAFASWPPDVQQKVSAGQVDLGFTMEQVRVARGNPDYVYTRTTQQGNSEVWGYRDRRPRFGFGLGVGSFHGSSAYGGGISVGGPARVDERLRIIFDQYGRVVSWEDVRR